MNMKSNLSRATRISGRTTSAGWSEELWRVDMSGTELPCSYGQRVRGAPESLKNVTLKRLFIPGHAVSGIQQKIMFRKNTNYCCILKCLNTSRRLDTSIGNI